MMFDWREYLILADKLYTNCNDFYRKDSDTKRKQVGTILDRLRKLRNEADYYDKVIGLESSALPYLVG